MTRFTGAHIKVDDLTFRYKNADAAALEDISLTVEPGESLALIGRSGCGKSTLLHTIAGLNKATTGSVHIDGLRVTDPSPRWVLMFQQPSLLPWLTAAQNVALGLRFNNRSREIATRVPELLKLVELTEFADRNVQDLSGGQQQRVALARSLALKPDALLLDEPFSALDAFTRHSLQRDIRRITRSMGITLVLVTHEISEAVMMADKVYLMSANPGRIRQEITIDLPDERLPSSPEFVAIRDGLIAAYEEVAGLQLSDTVSRFPAAKKTQSVLPGTSADRIPQRVSQ